MEKCRVICCTREEAPDFLVGLAVEWGASMKCDKALLDWLLASLQLKDDSTLDIREINIHLRLRIIM